MSEMLLVWAQRGSTGRTRHCAGEVAPGLPTRLLGSTREVLNAWRPSRDGETHPENSSAPFPGAIFDCSDRQPACKVARCTRIAQQESPATPWRRRIRASSSLLSFQSLKALLMDFGDMQKAGNPFHHFIHLLGPLRITVAVFSRHQFDCLRQCLVTLGQLLKSFVYGHLLSPARWIRANISVPDFAPIVNAQNHLVRTATGHWRSEPGSPASGGLSQ
jgi:hypothetical protein